MRLDETAPRRRGRPPGSAKYKGRVAAPLPKDFEDQLVQRARAEGTSLGALVRRALYREYGYEEKTA